MKDKLSAMRESYDHSVLRRNMLEEDPIQQFSKWMLEAIEGKVEEPNAMILSTSTPDGMPSSRTVLLKGIEDDSLIFYTNYGSKKSEQLEANPQASLLFFWMAHHRQIRIEGTVQRVDRETSVEYFQSRPKGSQIGAWASNQSEHVENREALEKRVAALEEKYADVDVLPCPENWGGYALQPDLFEFWQGRMDRVHDRFQYVKTEEGWKIDRLQP